MKDLNEQLLDFKARQLAGDRLSCPRCGSGVMNTHVTRNALSRHADVYICDDCGTAEAMLDLMQNPLPLNQWALFHDGRPISNFKLMPGPLVWDRLQKQQIPYLMDLYRRWLDAEGKEDFEAYRAEAYRHCPGLTHLWLQPFQVIYQVCEGQLLVRFKKSDAGVETAHDVIPL